MITVFNHSDLREQDMLFEDVDVHSFRGSHLNQVAYSDLVFFVDGRGEESEKRVRILKNRYRLEDLSPEQILAAKNIDTYRFNLRG
jgi:hypothetical protein